MKGLNQQSLVQIFIEIGLANERENNEKRDTLASGVHEWRLIESVTLPSDLA
jgi:hypothetical protein